MNLTFLLDYVAIVLGKCRRRRHTFKQPSLTRSLSNSISFNLLLAFSSLEVILSSSSMFSYPLILRKLRQLLSLLSAMLSLLTAFILEHWKLFILLLKLPQSKKIHFFKIRKITLLHRS